MFLIMNEIPVSYKDNLLLKKLSEVTVEFASFSAYIADDWRE